MHRRYLEAAPPKKGGTASLAYRLRLVFLDRWNLWSRLTRYRKWRSPNDEQLDGTNNACERAIAGAIKERYRSMRGDIGSRQCAASESALSPLWQLPQTGRGGPGTFAHVSKR